MKKLLLIFIAALMMFGFCACSFYDGTDGSAEENETVTCTLVISCKSVLNNMDKLKTSKKEFVTESGLILDKSEVTVNKGSTVFDVLRKGCENNVCTDNCIYCQKGGIQFDYVYTPGFDSNYIRGIHQIYEKDCSSKSGWLYSVNGEFLNEGSNKVTVKDKDEIEFVYTCDLGDDVGVDGLT